MQRRITKRTRLAQKKRKKNILITLAISALLVIAYAGLGWGLVHEKVAITTIAVSGNEVISTEQLEATTRQGLEVVRGLLLYGGTIFTYNKEAIVSDLLHVYPRLKAVEIKASKIDTLDIVVVERRAVARWCEGESCYLLDENGFIFEHVARGPLATLNNLVTYTGDLSGEILRQSLLHGEFVVMHDFIQKLKTDVKIDVTEVRLLDGSEVEIISTNHPMFKIKLDEQFERTLSYVQVTLESQEYQDTLNAVGEDGEVQGITYIDLRFGNRVYYK